MIHELPEYVYFWYFAGREVEKEKGKEEGKGGRKRRRAGGREEG